MRHVGPNTRVEHVAAMHHVAPRTLQRLFRRYVGVGPKWVLKRLRIHRAAERLTATSPPRWIELALELGYYDHAHFIRDFRLIVGGSPAEYTAEAVRARNDCNPASGSRSTSRSACRVVCLVGSRHHGRWGREMDRGGRRAGISR
jgi:AraC-like DNA-binding protein